MRHTCPLSLVQPLGGRWGEVPPGHSVEQLPRCKVRCADGERGQSSRHPSVPCVTRVLNVEKGAGGQGFCRLPSSSPMPRSSAIATSPCSLLAAPRIPLSCVRCSVLGIPRFRASHLSSMSKKVRVPSLARSAAQPGKKGGGDYHPGHSVELLPAACRRVHSVPSGTMLRR